MDAVLLAGGVPTPDDPLYALTQGRPKALLPLAGKPMAQWVVDALDGATTVERIVVVGLPATDVLHARKPMTYIPGAGDLLDNILAGLREVLRLNPASEFTLLASSDIPAVTAEIVDAMAVDATREAMDVVYHVVTRETMEARFPGANRTYLRLRDVAVCGADLNVVRTGIVHGQVAEQVRRIIAARKNPLQEAAIVGWKLLLMVALRRWTLAQVAAEVTRRLHIVGAVHVTPYAEAAMDVDKPHQFEILQRDLAARQHSLAEEPQ